MSARELWSYLTSSLFFHRRFLLRHFLHFVALGAFLAPHSRQIFICSLFFFAIAFFNGSMTGICFAFSFSQEGDISLSNIRFVTSHLRSSFNSSAVSPGFRATLMPAFLKASILPSAVPVLPIIIAPACPMRFPGGAERPAMNATTGF